MKKKPTCPSPIKEDKPISIILSGMSGESGASMTMMADCRFITTIEVNLGLSKDDAMKYSKKRLGIDDLNEMIKNRK